MTRRSKFWLGAAAVFAAGNLGFAVFVVFAGEFLHAAGHVALAIPAAYAVWRMGIRNARANRLTAEEAAAVSVELDGHLTNLEQSIDAVALEVERIGEGQRFMTRLFNEHSGQPDAGVRDAVPERIPTPV